MVDTVTITNDQGAQIKLSTIGAGILSILVPDRDGRMADVVMGYENLEDYISDGPCAGKIPGRYANRIAAGRFRLDGKEYRLAVNCGPNHLHGGPTGFQNRIWTISELSDDEVAMTYHSVDGEEGYPGNLDAKVKYHWDNDCRLTLTLEAVTDAPTIVNLTNHSYFNLDGHDAGTALGHILRLNASKALEVDQYLTPLGNLLDVKDTPMDFMRPKVLGKEIDSDYDLLRYGKGYDHCYVVDRKSDDELPFVAELTSAASGRTLKIYSDQPGAQLYTGNWLTGSPMGKGGYEYHDYDCVAVECQGLPDAPNHDTFASQRLNPGETYHRTIVYHFQSK